MFENILKNCLIILATITTATILTRYFREKDKIFWDCSTYFIVLSIIYVFIPAISIASQEGILSDSEYFIIKYSLYFGVVMSVHYIYKTFRKVQLIEKNINIKLIDKRIIYIPYIILTVSITMIYILNYPGFSEIYQNRSIGANTLVILNKDYKIVFIFHIVATFALYLSIKQNKIKYLIMLIPFGIMDLLLLSRVFIYQILTITLVIFLINRRKIPIFTLSCLSISLVLMEYVRNFGIEYLITNEITYTLPSEIITTAKVGILILESSLTNDASNYIIYSLGKIFTSTIIEKVFTEIPNYNFIILNETTLRSLGSSILCEVFSFKSNFMLIIYPLFAIFYLEFLNFIINRTAIFGVVLFMNYLMVTHSIFRNGYINVLTEPFYYTFYAFSWYWILVGVKKINSISYRNKYIK
jgi:hypothetical protein